MRSILAGADAVLGPDSSAMGLDDLFGDRQSQPGILTESLMRPIGVKALEDPLQTFGPNARPVIINDDFHFLAPPSASDSDRSVGGRKRAGIVQEIVNHLGQPGIASGHLKGLGSPAL